MIKIDVINTEVLKLETSNIHEEQYLLRTFNRLHKNSFFHPMVKRKLWDGRTQFFKNNYLPVGLIFKLRKALESKKIQYELLNKQKLNWGYDENEFNDWYKLYLEKISNYLNFDELDYQIDAVRKFLFYKKCCQKLATNAGKTYTLYIAYSFLKETNKINKMLVIVPRVDLVLQFISDFKKYSNNKMTDIQFQAVYSDSLKRDKKEIRDDADIIIGTFQSFSKKKDEWFDKVNFICIDEAHYSNAKSIRNAIKKCKHSEYRLGISGTLNTDNSADAYIALTYLGPMVNIVTAKELVDKNASTPVEVRRVILKHKDMSDVLHLYNLRKQKNVIEPKDIKKMEERYVNSLDKRIDVFCSALEKLDGNVLVLFKDIKYGFGKKLYQEFKQRTKTKITHYVDGDTSTDVRVFYKQQMEENDNITLFASYGIFSTGISINNIMYAFYAEGYKSEIINVQTIGRGMRKHKNKDVFIIYDIVDDLEYNGDKNYLLKDGEERLNIYLREQHKVKTKIIEI